MKPTNYMFSFPLRDLKVNLDEPGVLIYNSFSNSLAAIEQSKFDMFNEFCKFGTPINDQMLVDQLTMGGFLVDDDYNEINALRLRMLRTRFQSSHFGLTIAPTSDCNFRCVYCYEKDRLRPSYMSSDVMDGVVKLLEDRVNHIRSFSVTWYGGEPLLAIDVIEKLSKRFLRICKKNRIHYSAGIITNGSLLTPEIVEKLNKYQVRFYQITIDGARENHNRTRPTKDGSGTYDLILSNIENSIELLPTVSLRVNVDKVSIQAAGEILKTLKQRGLDQKVHPYLGKITNDNNDPEIDSVCFSTRDFATSELKYFMESTPDSAIWIERYPTLKGNFCGADCASGYVVDSDGFLYMCWNDIGNKNKAIGNILDGKMQGFSVYDSYLLHDPTSDPICSKCKTLPICMGGCPYYRMAGRKDEQCSQYKYALDEYLYCAAERILRERHKT